MPGWENFFCASQECLGWHVLEQKLVFPSHSVRCLMAHLSFPSSNHQILNYQYEGTDTAWDHVAAHMHHIRAIRIKGGQQRDMDNNVIPCPLIIWCVLARMNVWRYQLHVHVLVNNLDDDSSDMYTWQIFPIEKKSAEFQNFYSLWTIFYSVSIHFITRSKI